MLSSLRHFIIPVLVLFLGFASVFGLSRFLETSRTPLPSSVEDSDLALQGKRLKGFALGADGLLADWYWIQSLQYLGGKIDKSTSDFINIEDLSSLNPRLLYPYLDNATDLDPHFMAAYSYGAIVLPAIDRDQAIKLTEKGIANNPDQFRLYQYLGYIYWRLKDYPKAAEIYERGSKIKDAPSFMKMMAASMTNEGGSRETSRSMYRQMLAEAQDAQTKSTAEFRLRELDSLDQLDLLNANLESFKEKNGRCVRSWNELINFMQASNLPQKDILRFDSSNTPVSPNGTLFTLNSQDCTAKINPNAQ